MRVNLLRFRGKDLCFAWEEAYHWVLPGIEEDCKIFCLESKKNAPGGGRNILQWGLRESANDYRGIHLKTFKQQHRNIFWPAIKEERIDFCQAEWWSAHLSMRCVESAKLQRWHLLAAGCRQWQHLQERNAEACIFMATIKLAYGTYKYVSKLIQQWIRHNRTPWLFVSRASSLATSECMVFIHPAQGFFHQCNSIL